MQFVLTTWSHERMIGYEPINAMGIEEAVSYVQGILSERTKGYEGFLIESGIRYCVDSDIQNPSAYILNSETLVGTWHLVPGRPSARLVWVAGPSRSPTNRSSSDES